MTATYVIEGRDVTAPDRFWTAVGAAVNGPGGYFGSNLDALADCLRGGFGTPDDGDFAFVWRHHAASRRALGHTATARWLAARRDRVHPANRSALQAELDRAEAGEGPTFFDRLVAVFEEEAPGRLRLE
ncbi:barstar family protein [Nocardiopsis coralliicola]